MFTRLLRLTTVLCLFAALRASAAVLYVSINSTNPVAPFSSWATAATNIQDAVDAASSGDQVLVTNGVYQYGGRVVPGLTLTNRLAITNAISVQSINGPGVTVIRGYQMPGTTNGPSAVRCVFLTNGASLAGFTLTNGATGVTNGGPLPPPPMLPYTMDNYGGGAFCATPGDYLSNCVITGNAAYPAGGGTYFGTLISCTLTSNSAPGGGGGSDGGLLTNCILSGNSGGFGGGAVGATLVDCIITGNSAYGGGGAAYGTLVNCLVTGNSAQYGGGFYADNRIPLTATLLNCTTYGNTASVQGGGVACLNFVSQFNSFILATNCIVVGNSAPTDANYTAGVEFASSCTTPSTPGAITNDPLFVNPAAGNFRLQAGSPCVNAGNNAYVTTPTDLAGKPRISGGAVDIGAYELQFHYVDINSANPVSPFSSWATAATNIQDAVDAASNYDEVLVTNGVYQYGGRAFANSTGSSLVLTNRLLVTNAITVQSVNGPSSTAIQGYQVPGTTNGTAAIRCVYLTNNSQLIGFTLTNGATVSWVTVPFLNGGGGAFSPGGGIAAQFTNATLVNCIICGNSSSGWGAGAYGCILVNCVITNNTCFSPSGNGWGGGASRCTMTNCLVAGNCATVGGGGIADGAITGCLLIGNSAGEGGGAFYGSLTNCIVASNFAAFTGGGYYSDRENFFPPHLLNCTVFGNTASNSAGGIAFSTFGGPNNYFVAADNCIVFGNNSPQSTNYTSGVNFTYSCTIPLPPGPGNITNDPLFVNPAAGDFHLQPNSPCINAGNNAYVSTTNDLDGNPRISGGTVDIGAYEFQNPASIISYAWLQQYGLPADGSADFADTDHNGMNNWQKWIAGLDPTNPSSVLKMLAPTPTNNPPGAIITWQSVNTRNYFLQRATNLSLAPTFQPLATNIPGQSGTTSYTDTNAPAPGLYFYRVGVQHP